MDIESSRERRRARERERLRLRRRRLGVALAGLVALAVVLLLITGVFGGGGPSNGRPARDLAGVPSRGGAKGTPARGRAQGREGASHRHTAAGSLARRNGPPGHEPVPILMYHVINPPPAGAPFPGLYVSRPEFEAQMKALAQAGWHAVTMDQVLAYWTHGAPLPRRPIVLSFDNGYQSQYTNAMPVLRRLGWVGVENLQLTGLPPSEGGLSQKQVRGLVRAGWELDTQGYSHAELPELDTAELDHQVIDARKRIQSLYHVPARWFCYPSGHYDPTVVAAVKQAGYVGSTTVLPGWAHPSEDRYALHRLRVLEGTSPEGLLEMIEGTRGEGPTPSEYL